MEAINQEYLSGIIDRLKKEAASLQTTYGEVIPSKEISLSLLTKTPEKFILHIRYFIDHRTPDLPDVHFNEQFTRLIINADCRVIRWNHKKIRKQ